MALRRDSLSPPERPVTEMADPGAHELDAPSDSDDHFSDAHSGPVESRRASPIPRTRVEKVDDSPSYGEVPGTEAYRKREGDAAPDEIAIIPEKDSLKLVVPASGTSGDAGVRVASPTTPGGHPIPKTVVEEAPDSPGPATPKQVAHVRRSSDAAPDVLLKADGSRVEAGEVNGGQKETGGEMEGDAPPGTDS